MELAVFQFSLLVYSNLNNIQHVSATFPMPLSGNVITKNLEVEI